MIGQHNISSKKTITACTKWCPPETGDISFERAEEAVGLALTRMGQKRITLLQCKYSLILSDSCIS